jgi:hypothetical protein
MRSGYQTLPYHADGAAFVQQSPGMQSRERKNGQASVIFDTGVAYLLNRDIQLDFSICAGAAGSTPPRSFFSLGISKRF